MQASKQPFPKWLALAAAVLVPALASAQVELFADKNFRGRSQTLGVGRHDIGVLQGGVGNDAVSSVRVPAGWAVTLFEHGGFQGRTKLFTSDASWVGMDFNDKTSGVEITGPAVVQVPVPVPVPVAVPVPVPVPTQAGVALYADGNFQGRTQTLGVGRHDIGVLQGGVGNDMLSSLRIPAGWTVTLFEHGGFQGRTKKFTGDTPWVGDDFNDLASGIEISGPVAVQVPVPMPVPVPPQDGVVLYADGNFQGRSQTLGAGRHDIGVLQGGIGNDTLSSLKIPAGWTVVVFEHGGFQGRTKKFTGDTAFVGGDFNDLASGIEIAAPPAPAVVTLYADGNFQGRTQTLGTGRYDLGVLASGIGNDTLSSLRVPAGWTVVVYEHGGFQGRTKAFTADAPWVGDEFNDLASGLEIFGPGLAPVVAPPPPPPAPAPAPVRQGSRHLRTDKPSYSAGEEIVVTWTGMPANSSAWTNVTKRGAPSDDWGDWEYTYGKPTGTRTVNCPSEPGEYEARAYYDGGTQLHDRFVFEVR